MAKTSVQEILKPLFDYYRERELKLARLLYKKGATITEIANELDVTPQAVSVAYPKKELLKEGK